MVQIDLNHNNSLLDEENKRLTPQEIEKWKMLPHYKINLEMESQLKKKQELKPQQITEI